MNNLTLLYAIPKWQDLPVVDSRITQGPDFCFCSICGQRFYSESQLKSARRHVRKHLAVGPRTTSINECISPLPTDSAPGVHGQYLMLHPPHLQLNVLPVNVVAARVLEYVAPAIFTGDFGDAELKYPSKAADLIVRRIIKD